MAVGGDLSIATLLAAYDHGIFPWFNAGERPQWWSPDPRAVIDLDHLHISRSLARTLRRGSFSVSWNRQFSRVMEECASGRHEGTWIFPEMIDAYTSLHEAGHAHSIEVWRDDDLVGGLYGVRRRNAFFAESMFHRETDASKVALVRAVQDLWQQDVRLFDVQFLTPHLASMGAHNIRRGEYLERVKNHT